VDMIFSTSLHMNQALEKMKGTYFNDSTLESHYLRVDRPKHVGATRQARFLAAQNSASSHHGLMSDREVPNQPEFNALRSSDSPYRNKWRTNCSFQMRYTHGTIASPHSTICMNSSEQFELSHRASLPLLNSESSNVSMIQGLRCLHSGQSISGHLNVQQKMSRLQYPSDAEAHFEHLHWFIQNHTTHERMHTAAGYRGPWIENVWISTFHQKWKQARKNGQRLSDVFGPFVPLLVNWVDLFVNANPTRFRYPTNFVRDLQKVLRQDVLYVTVSQNDEGILGSQRENLHLDNILVLSAGGYGHVPIPLLKQPTAICPDSKPGLRQFSTSFDGFIDRAFLRRQMRNIVRKLSKSKGLKAHIGRSQAWQQIRCDSRSYLCPRGFGRTSYRLAETIQAGRVPLFVYSDVPWIPYRDRFREFGFAVTTSKLEQVLLRINSLNETEIRKLEHRIQAVSESHFTFQGIMKQISLFLLKGEQGSDLRCQGLPKSPR